MSRIERPVTFEGVFGQDHPVKFLSGLIKRGQVARNTLLLGAVGSGKTTLNRIYGHALLCQRPLQGGSPCQVCAVCERTMVDGESAEKAGFFEYDVTGSGGDKERVDAFLARCKDAASHLPRHVVFFDEAHGLTADAADFLLKRVENSDGSVVYLFATSEHHRLAPALASRLAQLEVHPLSTRLAVAFLREQARVRSLIISDQALLMIATLVVGQPRDLVNAFEQIPYENRTITLEDVRSVFDTSFLDALRLYLPAIGSGDHKALTLAFLSWTDTTQDKVRWTRSLLAGMYYRDVLSLDFEADPVLELLVSERSEALSALRQRISKSSRADLASVWRSWLVLWSSSDMDIDDAAMASRFAVFHHEVCQLGAGPLPSEPRPPVREETVGTVEAETPGFITLRHVQQILDRSSFLIQEHGSFFNVAFDFSPDRVDPRNKQRQLLRIEEYCQNLFAEVANSPALGGILLVEGRGHDLTAYLRIHVPTDPVGLGRIRDWYRLQSVENWVELRTVPDQRSELKWHWAEVISLCGGAADLEAMDRDNVRRPLQELLKLGKRTRVPTVSRAPSLKFFGSLTQPAIDAASGYRMVPLSAVADQRWDLVTSGWERDEFMHRRSLRQRRAERMRSLNEIYSNDEERALEERKLVSSWDEDPRRQARSWATWW